MDKQCLLCDLKQVQKIAQVVQLGKAEESLLYEKVQRYLITCDHQLTNPEIMQGVWNLMTEYLKHDNPYEHVKHHYNEVLLSMEQEIKKLIEQSDEQLEIALKISICGNLIDFAAKHVFSIETLKDMLHQVNSKNLAINDSPALFEQLKTARTLLYLGDNCGEIVLDKLFINVLTNHFPDLVVTYVVRGEPIVNDVTLDDAKQVGMDSVAQVMSNGAGTLGTVLSLCHAEFQEAFVQADVIISKGQGNYEGLLNTMKQQLYFLFMAKCETIAKPIGVQVLDIVCLQQKLN